jgi:aminoglycoside phosphotransferase (APT) family kinase protein
LNSLGYAGDWRVRELGGGVSNTVLLAESGGRRWVVKQALGRLRVAEEWLADRARIHRECAALRKLGAVLPAGTVPRVAFEDAENFVYAMEAAGEGARDWKSLLLEGTIEEEHAAAAGRLMAAQWRATWRSGEHRGWMEEFGDQHCFDQLRLDPYYRFTARRHTDLAEAFEERIAGCARDTYALVHGDWSPKNCLVAGGRVTLIDFEVIHYGDPGFDGGFLLNHLLLKSQHRPGWASRYRALAEVFWAEARRGAPEKYRGWLEDSTLRHLGCLHLARVDGKSPAEYLNEEARGRVRAVAREMILWPPRKVAEVWDRLRGQ